MAQRPPTIAMPAAGSLADVTGRLAAALRRFREERGWTQEEAAHRCGLQVYGYRVFENGKSNFTASSLTRLAAAFGVDVVELLQPAPPPSPRPRGRPPKTLPQGTSQGSASPTGAQGAGIAAPVVDAAVDRILEAQRDLLTKELSRVQNPSSQPGVTPTEGHGAGATRGGALVSSRLVPVRVVVPNGSFEGLRDLVVAVLEANPSGLLAREVVDTVRRTGMKRLDADKVHSLLHELSQRGVVLRGGERGSFLYRLKTAAPT